MLRVLLVDDHRSFREPLAFFLGREPSVAQIDQAGSLEEARHLLRSVDLALVDLDLPDGRGETLVRELRRVKPRARALIVTASHERLELARAVEAGASGYVHKSASFREVLSAVRRLAAGETLLALDEAVELLRLAAQERERERDARQRLNSLTRREREMLQALADGLCDKAIGRRLHIGVETVRTHMVNLLGKLGVESRLQALVFALRHGAVTIQASAVSAPATAASRSTAGQPRNSPRRDLAA